MPTAIPDDIWRSVGTFVPSEHLRTLLAINRSFFDLAMNARYREVNLTLLGDRGMIKLLQRLRDPVVAKRVHSLTVIPDYWSNVSDDLKMPYPYQDVVQSMTDTVTHLTQVTEYTIEWDWKSELTAEEFLPFLTAAWATFGVNLRKLEVAASFSTVLVFLHDAGNPKNLQNFRAHLNNTAGPENPDLAQLAIFINQTSSTLRQLSIVSDCDEMHLASLFSSLGTFAQLQSLEISAPLDMCGLSDPSSVTGLLEGHAHVLKHVDLSYQGMIRGAGLPVKQAFAEWMVGNVANRHILANLESLVLLAPTESARLDVTMTYIERSAHTMTSLSLTGDHLRYEEVATLISALSPHRVMKSLSLCTKSLSSRLIELFAQEMPYLDTLNLFILNISSDEAEPEEFLQLRDSRTQARKFVMEMRHHSFPNWTLRDLSIVRPFGRGIDRTVVNEPMYAISKSVPALRSFFGEGELKIN
ncbi:hypothetical protein Hypma_002431 [Hypsizygus marmoreus]|uniref:F-box domain-containing protein n=1 Tax=Hypsizygus marmoreus TaxID=39966 RepID=A0A369J3X6_HYPMA|nr:hypothetical protein Hypma_002431 [Hypsizygus marmoreus]